MKKIIFCSLLLLCPVTIAMKRTNKSTNVLAMLTAAEISSKDAIKKVDELHMFEIWKQKHLALIRAEVEETVRLVEAREKEKLRELERERDRK